MYAKSRRESKVTSALSSLSSSALRALATMQLNTAIGSFLQDPSPTHHSRFLSTDTRLNAPQSVIMAESVSDTFSDYQINQDVLESWLRWYFNDPAIEVEASHGNSFLSPRGVSSTDLGVLAWGAGGEIPILAPETANQGRER
ncbi:hypothetical protein GQ53DRAFT_94907 [Thozetella sp. PMI_491]|nr:hypothetical protein GQ53DRAFT_94907 [Thozetella sp. PMI_491]